MKNTNIKLKAVSIEEMLADADNASYNPSAWKDRVNDYAKYPKCQFYIQPKDEQFSYDRFYVSYIADGIYFFSRWSAFSASLTSNPFCKAYIIDGIVFKELFKFSDGTEGCIGKTKEGRQYIRKQVTAANIMVSSCI